ncbi:sulfatase-like hydrolase/transferase [Bacillus sp. FJAT-49711]|uniref:sulfatase-like hydrolase/transferase n=1 Tax=Bacillus sp. FJAT-49711 TaxID=2833585 RepID=UPI00201639F3|nr:sulfatase-like hydrolase/transferase [Bacillus sp. FJAT-49711]
MKKPNILFILTDDQGAWALNCAGTTDLHTPNIDRLAENGVRFENFFCTSPVCSPARASLMTGNIPSAHGVQDWLRGGNIDIEKYHELKDNPIFASEHSAIEYLKDQVTYTDVLSKNGYTCALSGKWHLGDSVNPQQGFSKWFTIARGGCEYYNGDMVYEGNIYFEKKYITDVITDKAIDFLEELSQEDQPFYLGVHYTAPHSPWDEGNHPKEYIEMYRDCEFNVLPDLPIHPWQVNTAPHGTGETRKDLLRGYYASITAMDDNVGRIMDYLEQNGLIESTVIIFTSDNGMNMGHHGIWGKGNGTFPQNMFDTSVKVPFIVSHPTEIPQGVVSEQLVSQYDVFPTILDYLNIDISNYNRLPGKSFAETLKGESVEEDKNIYIYDEYGPVRMIRNKQWKYIHRYPYGPHEFYNLAEDPEESENLYGQSEYLDNIKKMKSDLVNWFHEYVDPSIDGTKEPVTGYGQLRRGGIYSEGNKVHEESDKVILYYQSK